MKGSVLGSSIRTWFVLSNRLGMWARGALLALALLTCNPVYAQENNALAASGDGADIQVDRARAQSIIGNLRRITTDNGIEELKAVRVGGIDQWISVRGRDRNNPILLFIHGGPAVPEMPASWFYQSPWEDYFTVVQWDQRGAGKTMVSSNPETLAGELSVDRFVSDAEEMVAYLRQAYGKKKIFVLGHSWGTIIGLNLALRRPEWLHAYIGMGQALDFGENERIGTAFALREAEAKGNKEAVRDLQSILPYPEPGKPLSVDKILIQRKWLIFFGGMTWNRHDFSFQEDAALLSPDYTVDDLRARDYQGITTMAVLPEVARNSLMKITRLKCPVFVFAGEHDYATSSELATQWFSKLRAPKKRLVRFKGVAHEIQFEASGKLLFHLVSDVRPLAVHAGDGAPAE